MCETFAMRLGGGIDVRVMLADIIMMMMMIKIKIVINSINNNNNGDCYQFNKQLTLDVHINTSCSNTTMCEMYTHLRTCMRAAHTHTHTHTH